MSILQLQHSNAERMKPFFAPEAFPPRTSRPPRIAWPAGHLPKQLEVFVLCHLLGLADGRAAPAQAPSVRVKRQPKARRRRDQGKACAAKPHSAEADGRDTARDLSRPGPPPLAVMIAAQSMRFACGACIRLLADEEGKGMVHKMEEIHGIHRECMHYVCGRYAGAHEQATVFGAMLRGVANVPSMLPYVRFLRDYYCPWAINQVVEHRTAAEGTVLLEALLDRAAAVGRNLVSMWPGDRKYPDSLLRCALKSGNVEYMRVVVHYGLFDHTLRADNELVHARKEDWPVSDGMRELLAQYFA